VRPPSERKLLAFLGRVSFDDAYSAEAFTEPAGHIRSYLASFSENGPQHLKCV
jgi:hypothetical protein